MTANEAVAGVWEALPARSLGDYLDALGSAAATPGGGSAGGIGLALAAALGEMVCSLTLARAGVGAPESDLASVANRLRALRGEAVRLGAADELAYGAYRDAMALPKATDQDRSARREATQRALMAATEVPLALAEACRETLALLETVAQVGAAHALSDALLGAYLARASLRGALLNLRGNAGMLSDPDAPPRFLAAADCLDRDGQALADAVERTAEARSTSR